MGLGDLVQKAVYLGVGLASFAGEKAGEKLGEVRSQLQKLADEMVDRGEMTTEEARRFVEEMVARAQQPAVNAPVENKPAEPRRIEIITDETDAAAPAPTEADAMRQKVMDLQEELRRLQRD
jgi:polyhydroxyalkanoate synthesis regulator phasin